MRKILLTLLLTMFVSLIYAQTKKDTSASGGHMYVITHHIFDSTKVVGKWPTFPGGEKALNMFIKKEMKYPNEAKKKKEEGGVIINCMVDTLGNVLNPKVIKSISPLLDREALRIVKKMPQLIPARVLSGQIVEMPWTIVIPFKLNDVNPKENNK